jgi:hypothetical protein
VSTHKESAWHIASLSAMVFQSSAILTIYGRSIQNHVGSRVHRGVC